MNIPSGDSESSSDLPTGANRRGSEVERLFEEHNEALVRFLRVRLDSVEEAREVAQEAYVRLLQLDQPNAVSHFRAFLFRTAANLAIDRVRKRQHARRHQSLTFFDQEGPAIEETAVLQEKIKLVEKYLAELPPKCRKAFLLARFRDMTTKDIASQMRLSERSVRNYILQAVSYCRNRLDKETGDTHA